MRPEGHGETTTFRQRLTDVGCGGFAHVEAAVSFGNLNLEETLLAAFVQQFFQHHVVVMALEVFDVR